MELDIQKLLPHARCMSCGEPSHGKGIVCPRKKMSKEEKEKELREEFERMIRNTPIIGP